MIEQGAFTKTAPKNQIKSQNNSLSKSGKKTHAFSKVEFKGPGIVSPGKRFLETSERFRSHHKFNVSESFAFGAITRDHYYDVHGEKTEKPKNGNYYPRFDLIEK